MVQAGEASLARVRSVWGKFNELKPILTARGASLKLKGKIYRTCVQSVMVYGSETWPMKIEDQRRLERTERMMVRSMCGVTLRDRVKSVDLYERLGVSEVAEVMRRGRLRWFEHVERKDGDDWVRACRVLEMDDERGRGRPVKTWQECINADLSSLGEAGQGAQDRVAWPMEECHCGKPSNPYEHGKRT